MKDFLSVISYWVLSVSLLLAAAAHAQQPPPARIDVARLGPQVGQAVPDFRLQDAMGKVWTRDSIMGPRGAMLVFSRSMDWCPFCKTQAVELQGRLAELRSQGLGVAIITYDPPAVLADFSRRRGITLPLWNRVMPTEALTLLGGLRPSTSAPSAEMILLATARAPLSLSAVRAFTTGSRAAIVSRQRSR